MPIRHARLVPWIVIAALAMLSSRAGATCPENYYYCNQKTFPPSFEPRVSLECLGDPANQIGRSSISYDLVSGRLTSFSGGIEFGAGAGMNVRDHYDLLGPVDTVCMTAFRVEMHVMAKFQRSHFDGQGDLEAFFRDENGFGPRIRLNPRSSLVTDTVLTMDISRCPGNGFELQFELDTGCNGGSYTATAQIDFTHLHPLVQVVSCQGFHTEPPIATEPVTWGRLRAHYR